MAIDLEDARFYKLNLSPDSVPPAAGSGLVCSRRHVMGLDRQYCQEDWENIGVGPERFGNMFRLKVPGGWLVSFVVQDGCPSPTFMPDPTWAWTPVNPATLKAPAAKAE